MAETNSINNKTSALEVNGNYSLPTVDGTNGQVIKTNGSGTLTWSTDTAGVGILLQEVSSNTSSLVTCSTIMPNDDTIPVITEGDEILTVTLTPNSATNRLLIEFSMFVASGAGNTPVCALFQDTTTNALAAVILNTTSAGFTGNNILRYAMTTGTTSSTTFKIRVGPQDASSLYVNGLGAARKLGGVASTILTIKEYKV